jgi:hypothetical protein
VDIVASRDVCGHRWIAFVLTGVIAPRQCSSTRP